MVLEAEYQKAVAALEEAGLPSLDSFVKEQGLKDEVLLRFESEKDLKELLLEKLQPFTQLWFKKYSLFDTPRPFGAKAEEISYREGSKLNVKTENRDAEFKSFRPPPPHVGPKNSLLTWRMMEKAKSFICGCLNADRKGIIYFGVADQDHKILGLEIENMIDEITTAFQHVLSDHIKSDTGAPSLGEQDGVKLHFIQVKNQGNPTKLYVIEIEVERKWMFCEDKVYYGKTWTEKKDSSESSKKLKTYFNVKPDEWDDAQVRLDGNTTKVKKAEVHEIVKKPLQKKYKDWKKAIKDYSNSSLTDELTEEAKSQVVTEPMITSIYEDLATSWRKLAPHLGINNAQCGIIDGNEREVEEKARKLCFKWKHAEGNKATVGRLVDSLEKIGKKNIAEKLLAKAAEKTK